MIRKKYTRFIAGLLVAISLSSTCGSGFPFHEKEGFTVQAAQKKKLNRTKASICKKETLQLKMQGTSKKAAWKSSKASVASVSASGKVTGKTAGTAVITATVGAKKYKCNVTVKKCTFKDPNNNSNTTTAPTSKEVYQNIIKMKEQYPEGMPWTNSNSYRWKGGIYSIGYGCAGFAFLLSDAAFGSLPARKHTNFSDIKVGDILRINNDTHSVIVLEINENKVVVAEGNYNKSIHWGRTFDRTKLEKSCNYVLTRYPKS